NVDSVGLLTARSGIRVTGGVIEAQAGENKIPSLYANMAALPSASTYHGMFAHVHSTQKGYFAHAGGWYELVNKETNGNVGTGTETYNIGSLTATAIDLNGDLDVDGHTNLDNVSIAGIATVTDLDVDGHTELDNVNIVGVTTFNHAADAIHPLKIASGNGTGGISTYLFTSAGGVHEIRFEQRYNGNWNVNNNEHMRLVWSAPNENAFSSTNGDVF
ncbi:MAG: hypothetical protein VXY93_17635, partial [Pseudomonadota bacterium]|nr:hypothetical protein [Pseudomonadota bacterium]